MSKERLDQLEGTINRLEKELGEARAEINSLRTGYSGPAQASQVNPAATRKATAAQVTQVQKAGKKPFFSTAFELLGENILGRLGILTVLVAVGWFLMYAFQNRWINESGRIYLTLAGGTLTILASYYTALKKIKYLPYALAGLGFSAIYLAMYSAYFFYGFFTNTEAFIYLTAASLVTTYTAYRLKSESLYTFALTGIMIAPLLLSTGENSYRFLFSYLLIVHILHLFISYRQPFRISGTLLTLGTIIIYLVWAGSNLQNSNHWIPYAFLILTEVLLIWKILKQNADGQYHVYDSILLGFGVFLYATSSIMALDHYTTETGLAWLFQAWVVAVPLMVPAKHLQNVNKANLNVIVFLMIAFLFGAVTDISDGSLRTLSWILFAAVLAAAAMLRNLLPLLVPAVALYFMAFIRLLFFDNTPAGAPAVVNTEFGLYLLLSLSLGANYFIVSKEERKIPAKIFVWTAFFVLILASLGQVPRAVDDTHYINLTRSYVLAGYCVLFLIIGFKLNSLVFRRAGIGLAVIIMIKFYFYDIWTMSLPVRIIAAFTLGAGLITLSFFYQRIKSRLVESLKSGEEVQKESDT